MKLKIKDDVDLKELGFEKDKDDFIYTDSYELLIEVDRTIITSQFDTSLRMRRNEIRKII